MILRWQMSLNHCFCKLTDMFDWYVSGSMLYHVWYVLLLYANEAPFLYTCIHSFLSFAMKLVSHLSVTVSVQQLLTLSESRAGGMKEGVASEVKTAIKTVKSGQSYMFIVG